MLPVNMWLNFLFFISLEIVCPELTIVPGADIVPQDRQFSAVITYECGPGMRMEDGFERRTIECMNTSRWNYSMEGFTCEGMYYDVLVYIYMIMCVNCIEPVNTSWDSQAIRIWFDNHWGDREIE